MCSTQPSCSSVFPRDTIRRWLKSFFYRCCLSHGLHDPSSQPTSSISTHMDSPHTGSIAHRPSPSHVSLSTCWSSIASHLYPDLISPAHISQPLSSSTDFSFACGQVWRLPFYVFKVMLSSGLFSTVGYVGQRTYISSRALL
jgi:hypothetical protein